MYIFWVLTTTSFFLKLVDCTAEEGQTDKLLSAVKTAKDNLDQQSEVRPPVVDQKLCLQLTLLSAVHRVFHHNNNLWRTECEILLLEKAIDTEQDTKKVQKLKNELQAQRKYEAVLLKNGEADKKRLLDLLNGDLNNLNEALKTLSDLKKLEKLRRKLPDFPRDACKKYNCLWSLKTAVDELKTPSGQYECEGKDQIEGYLREFNQFLLSFFAKEFLEFVCAQFQAQKTYMDVAKRALGVASDANEFKNKLFNNQDPQVQSILYKIHGMHIVEKCSDGEIGEALKQHENENSVAALEELLKRAFSHQHQATEENLKKKAGECGLKVKDRAESEEQEEQPQPQEQEQPQERPTEPEEQKVGNEEAAAAEEERRAREAAEQSENVQKEQESQQKTADERSGEETEQPQRKQKKQTEEEQEETEEQTYEQWEEDWPFERRCDPPCRILRLSEFILRQGFGTGKNAEDAKPVSGDYPYGGILST